MAGLDVDLEDDVKPPKPKSSKYAVERGWSVKRANGTLYNHWWGDKQMAECEAYSDVGEQVVKVEIREVPK